MPSSPRSTVRLYSRRRRSAPRRPLAKGQVGVEVVADRWASCSSISNPIRFPSTRHAVPSLRVERNTRTTIWRICATTRDKSLFPGPQLSQDGLGPRRPVGIDNMATTMPSSSIDGARDGLEPVEGVVEWKSSCSIAFVVLFARVTTAGGLKRPTRTGSAGTSCFTRRSTRRRCVGLSDVAGGRPARQRINPEPGTQCGVVSLSGGAGDRSRPD